MDRILIILKKENDPRASSASALGLNTIIFQHVCWYMQQTQVSIYRTIGPLVCIIVWFPAHKKSIGNTGNQNLKVRVVLVPVFPISRSGWFWLPVFPILFFCKLETSR